MRSRKPPLFAVFALPTCRQAFQREVLVPAKSRKFWLYGCCFVTNHSDAFLQTKRGGCTTLWIPHHLKALLVRWISPLQTRFRWIERFHSSEPGLFLQSGS